MKYFLRKFKLFFKYLRQGCLFDYLYYKLFGPYKIISDKKDHILIRIRKQGLIFDLPKEPSDYLYSANPIIELLTSTYFRIRDGVFIDIGAFIGKYSLKLGKQGIKVLAIEPNKTTFKILENNVSLNRLNKNVICVNKAIYPDEKTRTISFIDKSSTSRVITNKDKDITDQIITQVSCITFSGLLNEYSVSPKEVGLIKIDVEGFELDILKSMSDFFEHCNDKLKLICEILPDSPDKRELIAFLRGKGFTYKQIDENNYFFSYKGK